MGRMIVEDRESIVSYINDFCRYKESKDIESVYILLYLRENKYLLDRVRMIDEGYIIKDENYIELTLYEYDEIGYKVSYKNDSVNLYEGNLILEKLRCESKNMSVLIYIRLNIKELKELVENDVFIRVFTEEDMCEKVDDFIMLLKKKEIIKNKIDIILDNYKDCLYNELYSLVILKENIEKNLYKTVKQGSIFNC